MKNNINKCPVSKYCGGCQFQGFSYSKQLEIKQQEIDKQLSSFHPVNKIIGMENPDNYRNKVQINFAYDDKHNIISGYYIPSTHIIVPIEECMICDETINEIIKSIKRIITKYRISIFDEKAMKGCLRHVLIRSTNLDEYMVVLVTGSATIVKKDLLIKDILKYNPKVKTIVHNINNKRTSMVLGSSSTVLYGSGYVTDELCGLKFRISASSFYQVNKRQTEILYNKAIEAANLKKSDVLLDAYCGTGTIGLVASKYCDAVIGVESNRSAIKDAQINRKINNIKNTEFVLEDAGKYMEYLSKQKEKIDVVIMDPPRAGSDIRFMSSMVKLNPSKIVYISCNPYTLKDNLKYLSKYYKIKSIQPVDMFPYTDHIETIVQLSKEK